MYISKILVGVFITISVELLLLIAYGLYLDFKNRKK
nr:MAG TPA: hypothetical protein [Caudoviricetes sp.]